MLGETAPSRRKRGVLGESYFALFLAARRFFIGDDLSPLLPRLVQLAENELDRRVGNFIWRDSLIFDAGEGLDERRLPKIFKLECISFYIDCSCWGTHPIPWLSGVVTPGEVAWRIATYISDQLRRIWNRVHFEFADVVCAKKDIHLVRMTIGGRLFAPSK